MIVFEQLWVFILLPLPLLMTWLGRAYKTQRDALRAPIFSRLVDLSGGRPGKGALILRRNFYQQLAAVTSWILLVSACADPQWIGDAIVKTQPSRDLMLAVDLSGSMEAEDFVMQGRDPVDRLTGVKQVLATFVQQREEDRLGLIVFGSAPYLQIPFTLDHALFLQLLDEAQIRMAGPKTMLGDAIGLSVKHFASSTSPKKVLILLTDGSDSGSLVPPLEAARVARDEHIVIHTIAVGDPAASNGQEIDLETLQAISELTGGMFYRAEQGDQLQAIYGQLDELEEVAVEVSSYRPKRALYYWPLGISIVMQMILQVGMALTSMSAERSRRRTAGG